MRRSKWHRERSSDWSDVIGHITWKTISFKKILAKLAGALEVSADELKLYDTREPIADLNRFTDSDPKLGSASRTVVVAKGGREVE
jgi:hypothetical protein